MGMGNRDQPEEDQPVQRKSSPTDSVSLAPVLTPHGRLTLVPEAGAPHLDPALPNACRRLLSADRAMVFCNWARAKRRPRCLRFSPTGANSARGT